MGAALATATAKSSKVEENGSHSPAIVAESKSNSPSKIEDGPSIQPAKPKMNGFSHDEANSTPTERPSGLDKITIDAIVDKSRSPPGPSTTSTSPPLAPMPIEPLPAAPTAPAHAVLLPSSLPAELLRDTSAEAGPSRLSSSSFAPLLPSSLPQPQANGLPANRKRKTPNDFFPAGPGDAATPASPSKSGFKHNLEDVPGVPLLNQSPSASMARTASPISPSKVKFEDGLGPGEGKIGERTLPALPISARKNQNMIERTIWTFIMIAGFVGELHDRPAIGHC